MEKLINFKKSVCLFNALPTRSVGTFSTAWTDNIHRFLQLLLLQGIIFDLEDSLNFYRSFLTFS